MLRLKFASNIWSYRQLCGTFESQKYTAQPTHIFQQRSAGLRTGCSYIMRTKSHHLSYILRKYPGRSDNTSSKTNISSSFGIGLSVRTTSGQGSCPPPKPEKKYIKVLLYGLIAVLTTALGVYYSGLLDKKEKGVKEEEKKRKASTYLNSVKFFFNQEEYSACPESRWPKAIVKIPESTLDIPDAIPYLLIGGGTASFAAFRAIKSSDPKAKVLVISNENYLPYMRPPLSKEIWFNDTAETTKKLQFKQWNGMERSIFYEPEDFYVDCKNLKAKENGGVAVAQGWTVKRIDATEKKAVLEDGYEIHFDKCLIATGSTPKNLPVFEKAASAVKQKVSLYRGIHDFEEINDIISDGAKEFAIVGGGFLGSELACALARRGKGKFKVHQIYREPGNMAKVLPEYLSSWTTNKVKAEGVNIINNAEVEDVSLDGDNIVLKLSNGNNIKAAHAIVAVGVTPNTELAKTSSLELDEEHGGFLVNAELMARTNLWAAGDCTCFYDVKLGRRRVEHHDHAVVSGRLAGENMTGAGKPYLHQSMFWSDLGPDVGYEAIGIVDSSLPTVGVFAKATEKDTPKAVVEATGEVDRAAVEELAKPPSPSEVKTSTAVPKPGEDYGKGVIFYLRNDIVVGIIMWNVFNRMSIARQVLKEEKKYDDLNEVAKLFNIHEE